MPNWCMNEVTFYFEDEETRDDFLKSVEDWVEISTDLGGKLHTQKENSVFRFNKILPMPVDDEDFDWHEWCCRNWGTKWEPDVVLFDRPDKLSVYMEMYTAWSPPLGIYEKLHEDWEHRGMSCDWFYREDGIQVAGWLPH